MVRQRTLTFGLIFAGLLLTTAMSPVIASGTTGASDAGGERSSASRAPSFDPAVVAREWSSSKKGRVVVVFKAPRGVPASVRLSGRKKAIVAKPEVGKTAQVVLPPGRYKVMADVATLHGSTFQPRLKTSRVSLAKGKTVKVVVAMKKVKVATDLAASELTATSVKLLWKAPRGAKVALRRTLGDAPATSPTTGALVTLTRRARQARKATDAGLKAGAKYRYTFFSRLPDKRWVATPGLTVSTPTTGEPAYVVKPGAIVVEAGDPHQISRASGLPQVWLTLGVDGSQAASAAV